MIVVSTIDFIMQLKRQLNRFGEVLKGPTLDTSTRSSQLEGTSFLTLSTVIFRCQIQTIRPVHGRRQVCAHSIHSALLGMMQSVHLDRKGVMKSPPLLSTMKLNQFQTSTFSLLFHLVRGTISQWTDAVATLCQENLSNHYGTACEIQANSTFSMYGGDQLKIFIEDGNAPASYSWTSLVPRC